MPQFLVSWTINIEADSAEAAALEAWDTVRAADSEATYFEVQEFRPDMELGPGVQVDVAVYR